MSNTINILAVGDVVSASGCEKLRNCLPKFKRENNIDVTVVNGENSAVGNGILPMSADDIFTSGADVVTGGNHTFRRREIYNELERNEFLLRPANYGKEAPGRGYTIVDRGAYRVGVVNLCGTVFMEPLENPFICIDRVLEKLKRETDIIIVDFHAEATAEKRAMGFYLDGRASAVFGTHTHVPTADEQILPHGTGYITDVGMTGPKMSVLGVTPELAIEKMKTNLPVRFQNPDGEAELDGVIFTVSRDTAKPFGFREYRFKRRVRQ